jgi:DNA repair exonuclease SbcCD ATPase subunit
MSRKNKKKRDKLPAGGAERGREAAETISGETRTSSFSNPFSKNLVKMEPATGTSSGHTGSIRTAQSASVQEEPPDTVTSAGDELATAEGFFSRLARWWLGPTEAAAVQVTLPEPARTVSPEVHRLPATPSPNAPLEPARIDSQRESTASAAGRPSAEQVQAMLAVERVQLELDATRRELREERERLQERIRQLEADRDTNRALAGRAVAERDEIEGHTNVLRRSVTALERQLQEERATSATRLSSLGGERDEAAAERLALQARVQSQETELQALRLQKLQLEEELNQSRMTQSQIESLLERLKGDMDVAQAKAREATEAAQQDLRDMEAELTRRNAAAEQARAERLRIEEHASLLQKALDVTEQQLREEREANQAQIQRFEKELAAGRQQESSERSQAMTSRMHRLESRWEDLKSRILPKDRELQELRQQTEEFRAKIGELEAALAEAQTLTSISQYRDRSSATQSAALGTSSPPLTSEGVEALYRQAMVPLTVLMASADLLMLEPGLKPDLQQSAKDIREQGQALLDIIKSFTLPPEHLKTN